MATRLAWWTIPATAVVALRVVTLGPERPVDVRPAPSEAVESVAEAPSPQVILRDASGARSGPIDLELDQGLVLRLPAAAANQRVDFSMARLLPAADEPLPWLHGEPVVRADATLPVLGLPAGQYSLELSFGDGDETRCITRDRVTVPGTVDLTR